MKKFISLMLVLVMSICCISTAMAYETYTVYEPKESCMLIDLQFTQIDNPWLLWDITFSRTTSGNILTTDKAHPNLIGCSVVPNITFKGNSVTFNGTDMLTNSNVTLEDTNKLIITDANGNRADYTIYISEETSGLPVVLIDTDGVPIETKTEYVDAHISILGAGTYNGGDIYNQLAEIKLRGNTTMAFDKKPYRIKFDKKQDVLGLGSAKSWVLLAGYLDPSLVRNQTAYLFARDLYTYTAENSTYRNADQISGESEKYKVFSPRMKMVEVYVNGVFQGLYDMGDHMQANSIRVDIDESGDEFAEDENGNEYQVNPEGNVGYLIEMETGTRVIEEGAPDSEDWSQYSIISNVGAIRYNPYGEHPYYQWYIDKDGSEVPELSALYFQFKLPENPSDEQINYITDFLQDFNDKLLSGDDRIKEEALRMIDLDSFIDWYIINELFKNPDSQMQSSCYLYKDKDSVLYIAPVWDFDIGAGGISYGDMANPAGWRTRNDEYCGWFRELFEMESFKNGVITRWNELHKNGIINNIFSNIEYFRNTVRIAAETNRDIWHESYANTISQSWMQGTEVSQNPDWDIQLDYFSTFLKNRIAWIDAQQFEEEITTEEITATDNQGYLNNYSNTAKITISGSPAIMGKAIVGNTLAVSAMSIHPWKATISYQWYRNDNPIYGAKAASYTVTEADIGSTVSVQVTGTDMYTGTLVSKTLAVSVPENPTTVIAEQ